MLINLSSLLQNLNKCYNTISFQVFSLKCVKKFGSFKYYSYLCNRNQR